MTNIYLITNNIDGKQYVGQTIKSLEHRFNQHYNAKTNCYIDNAMKHYGRENFSIRLICTCEDADADFMERYYIQKYKTHYTEGGYNISLGGDENPMKDPVAYEHWLSATHTEEYLEKQRIASTGRKHTEESKKKMSLVQKQLYKDNPELKKKIALHQPTRSEVNMVDKDGNLIKHFDTLSDACRYFNKDKRNTSSLRKFIDKVNKDGKRAKFWGYCWESVK